MLKGDACVVERFWLAIVLDVARGLLRMLTMIDWGGSGGREDEVVVDVQCR